MDWKSKNVLITGAGGFIGSHLVQEILDLGAEVRAFIRYTSDGHIGNLRFIPANEALTVFYGDLKDSFAVRKAMKDIDFVFHLASVISIPYSYINPREYFDNNIFFILNILEAAKELGTEFIVHTSTSEVYGTAQYIPIDEKHPLVGQSPYSASKIAADQVAHSFHLSFDSPLAILRPFNTFGPRQSPRAVIPTIITQLLTKRDLHIGDITTTRDFLYVKDTTKGFTRMAEKRHSTRGMTINIGTGREETIESVAKYLCQQLNPEAKILTDERKMRPKQSEVRRLCANADLAKKILDWQPNFTLEEGLTETIDWVKQNANFYLQPPQFS